VKSIVCFSGGIDSAVVLAMQVNPYALIFDYGQPHRIEIEYARQMCGDEIPHHVIKLPTIPLVNDVVFAARNAVMVSWAAAYAQSVGAEIVALGCNQSDWRRFPDCRPDFWDNIRQAYRHAYGVTVSTPLIHMTKAEVVQKAKDLGVDISATWSCYSPQNEAPCGECIACTVRKDALK
jgi:7-cyano-7-deazaguanine synthase